MYAIEIPAPVNSCFDTFTGWVGGWVGGCSGVIIKLNSVQLQLQLPAGTELGNTYFKTGYTYFKDKINIH